MSPATNWTEQTLVDSGFSERTMTASTWTEQASTGDLWVNTTPAPGYGIEYILLDVPIQQLVLPGVVANAWTEASL